MKYNMFTKLCTNTYEFIQEDIVNKFKTKEDQYFYEQFNQYLQVEDALFCYQLLDEKLKASLYQKNKLQTILEKKIINQSYTYSDIKSLKSIHDKDKMTALLYSMPRSYVVHTHFKNKDNMQHYDKNVIEFFNNEKKKDLFLKLFKNTMIDLKSYYKSGLDSHNDFYKKTYEENETVKGKTERTLYLCAFLLRNDLLKPEEINSCKEQVVDVCNYLTKKTKPRYRNMSFDKIGKAALDYFIENIELMQKDYLTKDNKKEMLMNQLKRYNARNKSLNEEIKDLISKEDYAIENLPLEAQGKIDTINKIGKELNNKEVNDFLHERLPLILKKYFSIDKQYRTELKNVEGYNAQELMIQSLENIEKIILAKKEDNNYDLISELSVENRKLKTKSI